MRPVWAGSVFAVWVVAVVVINSCSNRGEPFVPVKPGTIDSTKVDGLESGRWTKKASPYYVVADVRVPAGKTLTIEPGVIVIFIEKNLKLKVEGTLIAVGKPDSLITFRPTIGTGVFPTPGDWASLVFADSPGNRLECVRVQYATNGIVATNSEISVRNSVVTKCQFDAINLTRSSLDLVDCTIATNGGNGLTLNECEDPPYPVRITHCNIGFNQYAGIWAVNSSILAERSDIKNNGSEGEPTVEAQSGGLHFQGAPGLNPPTLRQCNIELNEPCDIRNVMPADLEVTADSLFWGPVTTGVMNALSNIPSPKDPRKENCNFDVPVFCDGYDIPDAGTVSFCWWRDEAWPNFSSSKAGDRTRGFRIR